LGAAREEADQREIGADVENVLDAVLVGEGAEDGGADAAKAEGEAEEEAGHRADFAGDELLRINENGGDGRGEDDADDRDQSGAPVWERQIPTTSRLSELDRIKRSRYVTLAFLFALTGVVRISGPRDGVHEELIKLSHSEASEPQHPLAAEDDSMALK
jgi:hypothetical protein